MSGFRPRSFTEYVRLVWRRRWLLLLVTAAVLTATLLVIARLPDVYESRAAVVVAGPQQNRDAVAARVATVVERLLSRSYLEEVARRQGLVADEGAEGAVARLRKNARVETKYRSDRPETLAITYRDASPPRAQAVVSDLVSIMEKMNQDIERETAEQAAALEQEIAEVEGRLRDGRQQRAAAAVRRSYAGRAGGAASERRARRAAAAASLETLGDRQYALEQQIAEQKRQVAEQEQIVRSLPPERAANSATGVLLVRKAELEAQLKDYATQYTDKNPKMAQTRAQLGEINRQIAEMNAAGAAGGPSNSAEARELRAMRRELARLETELNVVRRESVRKESVAGGAPAGGAPVAVPAPPAVAAVADPAPDADRLRERYTRLLDQQEGLEKQRVAAAGLGPGLFQVVDAPGLPRTPAGPDRLKLRLLALALALGIGLAVVVALEAPRLFAIRDERDVRYYLGAPVIALIPETLTPAERGRLRRLRAARGLLTALAVAVAVPLLVLLLNSLGVFHILASRW